MADDTEIVETMARAAWESTRGLVTSCSWDEAPRSGRALYIGNMKAALDAARPLILQEAKANAKQD